MVGAMTMIRVSQSVHSGKIVSRRPVETHMTRSGYMWSFENGRRSERFWRDPTGVWRIKRPKGPLGTFAGNQFRVWLEEKPK